MSKRVSCSKLQAVHPATAQCFFTASTKPKGGGERRKKKKMFAECTVDATVPLLSESSSDKV